jgi:hypothetical protein
MTVTSVGVLKVQPAGNGSGTPKRVYFEELGENGVARAGRKGQELRTRIREVPSDAALGDFQQALEGAMPAAEAILERIRSSVAAPTRATLEFGLRLTGTVGIITKGEASAHFVVTLTWERPKS